MNIIERNTEVISVSLPTPTVAKLEIMRKRQGQSRSGLVKHLIEEAASNDRWNKIFARGEQTAHAFKITSEDDIDRIIHST